MNNPQTGLALLVVDLQNDFCDGGALAVPHAAALVPRLNELVEFCETRGVTCAFTRDWHPPGHHSFVTAGGPWPDHCVQNTRGAEFADGLRVPPGALVAELGVAPADDGFSPFQDPNFARELRSRGIVALAVCGVATEYCVAATVRDALHLGFAVSVLEDLIRPINVQPGDGASALEAMREQGAQIETSAEWMDSLFTSNPPG